MGRRVLLLALGLAIGHVAEAARLLTITMPGGTSHVMELWRVTGALQGRGHEVYSLLEDWEQPALSGKAAAAGVQVLTHSGHPGGVEAAQAEFKQFVLATTGQPIQDITDFFAFFGRQCERLLRNDTMLDTLRALQPDLLIIDITSICGPILADLLSAPVVVFNPTSLLEPMHGKLLGHPTPPSSVPAYGSGFDPAMTFPQRLQNLLIHGAIHALGGLGASTAARLRAQVNLTGRSQASVFREARLVLVNADPALEYPGPVNPRVKMVGPLLAAPARPLPPHLESIMAGAGGDGAVYASFGSVFQLTNAAEARAMAAALSALNRTVLWRITDGELPPGCTLSSLGLPPRVHTLAWAPQNDVLGHPRLAAFISHGGTNSAYEAAYHGMPMVSVPFLGDNVDHAAKVAYRGYGLTVPRATLVASGGAALAQAVERVAAPEAPFRGRAKAVGQLLRAHPRPPAERAAEWVEFALAMPKGASLRSTTADVPWIVRSSCDVYAVLLAATLAAVGVLILLLRAAWRAMFGRAARASRPKAE